MELYRISQKTEFFTDMPNFTENVTTLKLWTKLVPTDHAVIDNTWIIQIYQLGNLSTVIAEMRNRSNSKIPASQFTETVVRSR